MLKQALLAASLMMVAGASQAEMIHADFNYGDRMVTVDTETGLAWMKFDLTRYYHLNSAEAATEATARAAARRGRARPGRTCLLACMLAVAPVRAVTGCTATARHRR